MASTCGSERQATFAAEDDGWGEFHKRARLLGLPQIPDAGIARRCAELIDGRDSRVLMLGVTRALAGIGNDLTVVDFSQAQIDRMWPGDGPDRRVRLDDWRAMDLPSGRFTAAIGDGSLSTLAWPHDHALVLRRVADCLAPGGRMAIRCFVAPEAPEALDGIAEEVLGGREQSWSAALWRIGMAIADRHGSLAARDIAAAFRRTFPDLRHLAGRTGWIHDDLELVVASYAGSNLRFSFVTAGAILGALPGTLVNARFVPSGDYPLSDRCPFLVADRAG